MFRISTTGVSSASGSISSSKKIKIYKYYTGIVMNYPSLFLYYLYGTYLR